jgi:hypothetical protein
MKKCQPQTRQTNPTISENAVLQRRGMNGGQHFDRRDAASRWEPSDRCVNQPLTKTADL